MGLLKFASLIVRGLNVPDLRKGRTQVAFLQETHFRGGSIPKLTNGAFPTVYHSVSLISKSKGVSILLVKSVPADVRGAATRCAGSFSPSEGDGV